MSQKITPSVLCSACQDMFNGNSPPCHGAHLNDSGFRLHHASPAQFRDAALQKCYICVRNWAKVPDPYRLQWSEGKGMFPSRPSDFMRYRFIANEEGTFRGTGLSSAVDMPWIEMLWNNMDPLCCWSAFFFLVPTRDLQESIEDGRRKASFSCDLYPNGTIFLDHDLSTSSLKTLQLAKEWCATCEANHEACNKRKSNKIPSRLMDIGSPDSTQWRLCLTADEIYGPVEFIALSYRWGSQSQALTLRESTHSVFCNGLPISGLPQTFQDAIKVAHFLKVRYLWIDSVCIFQDSPHDWEHESQMMSAVYSNAYCVLAAAASAEPNDSLFRARDPEDILPGLVVANTKQGDIPICDSFLLIEHESWQREFQASVLQWRGWCVQERILAPRVLHFAGRQLLWECDTSIRNECLVDNFPAVPPANKKSNFRIAAISQVDHSDSELDKRQAAFQNWTTIVEGYSKCLLTKANDKLVAISGLASFFEKRTKDTYLAGVWKCDLLAYLLWTTDHTPGPNDNMETLLERVLRSFEKTPVIIPTYRAPSWSWASLDQGIRFQVKNPEFAYGLATILDARVTTHDGNAFSSVVDGFVTIKGPFFSTGMGEERIDGYYHLSSGDVALPGLKACILQDSDMIIRPTAEQPLIFLPLVADFISAAHMSAYPLATVKGLVIQQRNSQEEYIRVGTFSNNSYWGVSDLEKYGVYIGDNKGSTSDHKVVHGVFKIF